MVKIIDAFIFYNELKMLKFRLTELYDVVDYFIIVESTSTFIGKEKELYYEKNKDDFSKFKDKIIHIIVNDMPNDKNAWNNEYHQRRCIDRGINKLNLNNNDIIIITDCDEIPNPKILNYIKNNDINFDLCKLQMELYYYNLECQSKDNWYYGTIIKYQKYKEIKDPQNIRFILNKDTIVLKEGGWHFSYFGDINFIKNKIKNFSHQEYNNDKYLNDEKIKEQIEKCDDIFFRNNKEVHNLHKKNIEENNNLPKHYKLLI